ncbi:NBR1-Ig-like domain-containing protein [Nonomuraea sp. NPDC050404]|uniref:NBR1-Ig-like domain-containing protein n=1 Tax=Nonomuraea sp. NPDC050404 TaxID=3155783 RepID=UPI0033C3C75B
MAETPGDEGAGARRGRRPIRPDPGSGPVALLAHRLWELKEQAGDPSFADMASRLGAAASKSSLAAAARGSVLPSWETTWEFVRVLAVDRLGRDTESVRSEWRAYWEEAGQAAHAKDDSPMPTNTPNPHSPEPHPPSPHSPTPETDPPGSDTSTSEPHPPGSHTSTPETHSPGSHTPTRPSTPAAPASRSPDPETRTSGTEARASGTGAHTPGAGTTPEAAADTPGAAAHMPEAGTRTPEAAAHVPEAGTRTPGAAAHSTPSTAADAPVTETRATDPGTSAADFGARAADPGNRTVATGSTGSTTPGTSSNGRSRPVILAAVLAVVGAGAVLIGWGLPLLSEDAESEPTPAASPTAPPTAPTASPRDDSVFERDVTYPDGSVVQAKSSFDKTWRIRNAGNVPWQDRYLTRMNDTPCKAPKRVGIGPVLPGESVDITVRVRAPESPGRCKIFWKMTDEDGTPLLAAKKPIFLDITVA